MNTNEILETINMIDNEDLDVRTITMGISLLDCIDPDVEKPRRRSTTRSAGTRKTL